MKKLTPKQYAKVLYQLTKEAPKTELEKLIENFIDFVRRGESYKKMSIIIEEFQKYARAQEGSVDLHVTSAHELTDATLKAIEKQFGGKAQIKTSQDASLIGGVVIRTENMIFDGSVKKQLQRMKETL